PPIPPCLHSLFHLSSTLPITLSDVTLVCLVSSETPVGPVRWYKGAGSERTHFYSPAPKGGDKNDPRVTWTMENTAVNYSITIRDVRVSDTGGYYCVKYKKVDENKPYASGPGLCPRPFLAPEPRLLKSTNYAQSIPSIHNVEKKKTQV
uniref:Ig-like domain-containing protein n=1 Tax=Erpetoichthys calabaricus TaxID=27687 RepID=A0A8C4SFI5_ERPCA